MSYNYCILGTGRQGTAAAYDLIKHANIKNLSLIDSNEENIKLCLSKLQQIIGDITINTSVIDITDKDILVKKLTNVDIFLSSVPYEFNLMLTEVALLSKTSMVDLGGHTENVIKQLKYDKDAKNKNITIVPDCGMGPGMNVSMALLGMEQLDSVDDVFIWDGGLPKNPIKPWNYSLFFNIKGLTNEYDECAFFLEEGKINKVPCFEGIETLNFDNDIGDLEAAVTSGGLSTMPWTYEGKIKKLVNKTLRYKGHWEWMKAFRQLGLFSETKIRFNNHEISPREFYHSLLEPQLDTKDFNDICVMRIVVTGLLKNKKKQVTINCFEEYDSKTGLMAMEKWTGWHASIVMQHIASGNIKAGAYPIEKAISGKDFHEAALKRNYNITISIIDY